MVAWMNRAALDDTLRTGAGHYWSRSRQQPWRKGETSGHVQHVDGLYADCDRDTLLVQCTMRACLAIPAAHPLFPPACGRGRGAPRGLRLPGLSRSSRAHADLDESRAAGGPYVPASRRARPSSAGRSSRKPRGGPPRRWARERALVSRSRISGSRHGPADNRGIPLRRVVSDLELRHAGGSSRPEAEVRHRSRAGLTPSLALALVVRPAHPNRSSAGSFTRSRLCGESCRRRVAGRLRTEPTRASPCRPAVACSRRPRGVRVCNRSAALLGGHLTFGLKNRRTCARRGWW